MKKASFLTRFRFSYTAALLHTLLRSRRKRNSWVQRTAPARVTTV